MDREAWRAVVHGVTKRWIQLSDWNELNWTDVKFKIVWLKWLPMFYSSGSERYICHYNHLCIFGGLVQNFATSVFMSLFLWHCSLKSCGTYLVCSFIYSILHECVIGISLWLKSDLLWSVCSYYSLVDRCYRQRDKNNCRCCDKKKRISKWLLKYIK